eukprot:scaffold30033_cov101-Isochrysis_galbana.AAC.4
MTVTRGVSYYYHLHYVLYAARTSSRGRRQSGADPAAAALFSRLAGGSCASSSSERDASNGFTSKLDESFGHNERPLMRTHPASTTDNPIGGASACDAPAGREAAAMNGACLMATEWARASAFSIADSSRQSISLRRGGGLSSRWRRSSSAMCAHPGGTGMPSRQLAGGAE